MYINTQTQQYPVSESQIRAEHSNTSFPKPFVAPAPYAWVFPVPAPTYDNLNQCFREVAPVQVNDKWQQSWEVFELNAEAKQAVEAAQAEAVRSTRNSKLAASDWTQLADSTADKAAWATHRQALRDITAQPSFPWDTQWPDAPV
jgi:hypothetical protein